MQKKAVLKKRLPSQGVDGILITDLNNVRYLTGFTGSSGFALITKNNAVFVSDFRYKEQAKMEVRGFRFKIENAAREEIIYSLVRKFRIKRLGFEDHHVSYSTYKKLSNKKIRLKALTGAVEDLRIIKTPGEIAHILTAAQRAERAFRKLQPFIKVGTTEQKLALKLEELIKKEGCKNLPFGVIVASGHLSALPHAKPTSRVIKRGDFVIFDWGGESEGYYSDMTRTVAIRGRNLNKQQAIYSIVLEAQRRAINAVRPGARSSAIDAAARGFIKQHGYGKNFGHGTGHGIGLEVHEKPAISWQQSTRVKEGMVFTIEPGIYSAGYGGVRIEDIVAVQKDGVEVLTSLPRKLKII
jgi:Xaa-Pro aminopeptidase